MSRRHKCRGERGFSLALFAHDRKRAHRPVAFHRDAACVKHEKSALVKENAEHRAEEKQANIAFERAPGWLDEDVAAIADRDRSDFGMKKARLAGGRAVAGRLLLIRIR